MKALSLFLIFGLFVIGCKKDGVNPDGEHRICNTEHPLEDIPWLKSEIAAVSAPSKMADYYASRAIYNGREILWISICCPVCSTVPPTAKYCDGSIAGRVGTDIVTSQLIDVTTIWKTENGICIID